jgi:PhoPQ-activated pathogenicity-related protein
LVFPLVTVFPAILSPIESFADRSTQNALQRYVNKADSSYEWEILKKQTEAEGRELHLELTSQTWRGGKWQHHLRIFMPNPFEFTQTGLLFITGDGDGTRSMKRLKTIAEKTGTFVAVLSNVPNQPLYGGRKEDALIAYTFDKFLKTGDETWPLLFPMVKSAVSAMQAIQECLKKENSRYDVKSFLVSGASKRGWTTWLTAAADDRVMAIAPMVIDTLNMKVQTNWAKRMFGRQSEQINDYTELNLVDREDDAEMIRLRSWVDPYSYASEFHMPKLILLGTNDPYWTVDSLRHYWDRLPEKKWIYQTPNAGHDLDGGKEAIQTLGTWYHMILKKEPLPQLEWKVSRKPFQDPLFEIQSNLPAESAKLWSVYSEDRDFRDNRWSSVGLKERSRHTWKFQAPTPESGHLAFMGEMVYQSRQGHQLKLSTPVFVTPDTPDDSDQRTPNHRLPTPESEMKFWLENMITHHDYTNPEIQLATGMKDHEIREWVDRLKIKKASSTATEDRKKLKMLPYPGGRHPRIDFVEGAVRPQRETKFSVFTPWDPKSYAVLDIPEAVWSNLGLTYLAHTHVPTIWSEQEIELKPLEWTRTPERGELSFTRTLPNGISFSTRIRAEKESIRMQLTLTNGTDKTLSNLRIQNCVMLKFCQGFNQQNNDNKVFRKPYATCKSEDGNRWVITGWTHCRNTWGQPRCPCLHSDPKFPDCAPGETKTLRGWFSFYQGETIEPELERLEAMQWWEDSL